VAHPPDRPHIRLAARKFHDHTADAYFRMQISANPTGRCLGSLYNCGRAMSPRLRKPRRARGWIPTNGSTRGDRGVPEKIGLETTT